MYLSPDGDALWMTFGRGSKEMIPTCEHPLVSSLPRLDSD